MALPDMKPVSSPNIAAIGHADGEEPALYVQFKNGGSFRYPGVTRDDFDALAAAESIGKHFNANIRAKFTGARLAPEE